MKSQTSLIVSLCLVFTFSTSLLQSREWTSADGRTMEANFIDTLERDGQTVVVFSKDDGIRYQVPLANLSEADQEYVRSGQAAREASAVSSAPAASTATKAATRAKTDFEQKISRNLVQLSGRRVSRLRAEDVGPHDYYAIYYSAAWCPPCRTFTPKLVDFYNEQKARHGDKFEIIFVSRDRDDKAMQQYITEYNMTWPAVDFGRIDSNRELLSYRGRGIPCLVLVDKDGKVLSHSYEGDNYVGPSRVMRSLEEHLGRGS